MGEYTGYILKSPIRKAYCWKYYSSFKNYENISIDAIEGGSLLRFVNDLEDHNVNAIVVPYNN